MWAELWRDGKKTHDVKLILTVKVLYVVERAEPVSREVARIELSHMQEMTVEDGLYAVKFGYGGKQYSESVRAEHGTLLAA